MQLELNITWIMRQSDKPYCTSFSILEVAEEADHVLVAQAGVDLNLAAQLVNNSVILQAQQQGEVEASIRYQSA
jgi:hypothetical protein